MRKKKQDKRRFLFAITVTSGAWIFGLVQIFGTSRYILGVDNNWIPMNPDPIPVMIMTTIMVLTTLYMWRWYQMDRVQQALSALNHDERQQLLLKLAQHTASDRLTLNEEGEISEIEGEPAVTYKRKNEPQAVRGAKDAEKEIR